MACERDGYARARRVHPRSLVTPHKMGVVCYTESSRGERKTTRWLRYQRSGNVGSCCNRPRFADVTLLMRGSDRCLSALIIDTVNGAPSIPVRCVLSGLVLACGVSLCCPLPLFGGVISGVGCVVPCRMRLQCDSVLRHVSRWRRRESRVVARAARRGPPHSQLIAN